MNISLLFASISLAAALPPGMAALRWEKRILLIAAPDQRNADLREQRRILARWSAGAEERDLKVVEIVGRDVTGVSDAAPTLRARYRLPDSRFSVILIGKDGGTKLRATRPIAAAALERTIDAMPMRRNRDL